MQGTRHNESSTLPLAAAFIGLPLALALAWQIRHLQIGLRRGLQMARHASVDECRPASPAARVLFLGDSTGVGVGAGRPEAPLPGLLGAAFPDVQITNRCRNGARVGDVLKHISSAQGTAANFDLALLLVGGNDVLRFTSLSKLAQQSEELLDGTAKTAKQTVWLGSANIGSSPRLIWPLNELLSQRTQRVMHLLSTLARRRGVDFIDFFRPREADFFARRADVFFADDGLHPSAASYQHSVDSLLQSSPPHDLLLTGQGTVRWHRQQMLQTH